MMLLRYNCSRKQTTATNDNSYYTIRYDSQTPPWNGCPLNQQPGSNIKQGS